MPPNTQNKKTRILVVDDHSIVRAGIRSLLANTPDLEVVGEAEDGRQAVREAARLRPDVILLDLSMPMLNGMEAARQLAIELPGAKILILSSFNDQEHLRQAVGAGAAGYLAKDSAREDLVAAVRETINGGAAFSPALLHHLYAHWDNGLAGGKTVVLTIREAEVLQLIAERFGTKQIADVLSLNIKTVQRHRQTLMDKLKLHKVADLTRYAVATGVVEDGRSPVSKAQMPSWQSRRKKTAAVKAKPDLN